MSLPRLSTGREDLPSVGQLQITILVLLVPDMGLLQQSLTLFMAMEHLAKEIFCCVKPAVQKPFQA